jgi:hypothetical protein
MEIHKVIYQHLIEQENRRLIFYDYCEETEIRRENLGSAILDTKNRLSVRLTQGKCSRLLIEQIARHRLNVGEKFNERIEFYNASEILDMLEFLENDKVKHTDFTGEILNGFSKIHHGTYSGNGYSTVRNIKEYWFKKGNIRNEHLNEFQQIWSDYEHHGISAILNMMHSKAMGKKELKGEWIVFKKHEGKKYYLCLASHYEDDKTIFEEKLMKCLTEFPELNS